VASRASISPNSSELTPLERNEVTGALGGANSVEAIAGAAVMVLAIIGLADFVPRTMLDVATMVAGAALFTEGVTSTAAFAKLARGRSEPEELVSHGGFVLQALGGAVGVALGFLTLIGAAPHVLISVAALAMGTALVLSGPAHSELDWSKLERDADPRRAAVDHAVRDAVGIRTIVGMGAALLGLIVLTGVRPMTKLSLVALMLIGAASLLGGSALLGRLAMIVRVRQH
jgi:hypothetical protein